MKKYITLISIVCCLVICSVAVIGCKKKTEQPAAPTTLKQAADATKATAESAKKTAETATKAADTATKTAESATRTAETATKTAESATKTAKTATKTAESATKAADTAVANVAAAVEQTTCPVLAGPIDKNIFVEYLGQKVYFCCADCKEKFLKEPEKYVANLPMFKK